MLETIDLDRGCFACALGGMNGTTLFMLAQEWSGPGNMFKGPRSGLVLTTEAPAPALAGRRTPGRPAAATSTPTRRYAGPGARLHGSADMHISGCSGGGPPGLASYQARLQACGVIAGPLPEPVRDAAVSGLGGADACRDARATTSAAAASTASAGAATLRVGRQNTVSPS